MKKAYIQISVQVDADKIKKIDAMAEKMGLTRSTLVRNFIETAYDDAVMLDKTGVFAVLRFGQKVMKKIREGYSTGKIFINKDGDLEIKKDEKDSTEK